MSVSLNQILDWVEGRLANSDALSREQQESIRVERPGVLKTSSEREIGFFFSRAYEEELPSAQPGILITAEPFLAPLQAAGLPLWHKSAVVSCPDPYRAMAVISQKFASQISQVAHLPFQGAEETAQATGLAEVHPSAVVDPSVILGEGVKVGPQCVVEKGAQIGSRTILYPGCYIGPQVQVGSDTVLFPRVTVYERTEIGNRVRIHAGAVIGADGFGYAPGKNAAGKIEHQKIYHFGIVKIEDDVEIGANCTVDRATFGQTRIEKGSKLDNLVHIGHNATVGEGSIICGGTCLAGNVVLGNFVTVGGLTGIANHVHVKDGAKVGACSLISKDVERGETVLGNPQRTHREHFKAHALLSKLLTERRSK